jgi:uncharacterized protein
MQDNMRVDELIILTLNLRYHKMIAGRTLLQKTIYFLNEILKLDIDFRPHYYGPYSNDVTNSTDSLNTIGFIIENFETLPAFDFKITTEPRKYSYKLTEEGKEIAAYIKGKYPDKSKKIKDTLDQMKSLVQDDYKILSIAAKMHHILKIEGKDKGMTSDDIIEEAKALKWNISEKEADAAIEFLSQINLVEEKQPKKQVAN